MIRNMRKTIYITLAAALLVLLASFTAFADDAPCYSGGSGTSEDPYKISTADDMWTLSREVKNGRNYINVNFRMEQDIDLSGRSWMAIGGNGQTGGYFAGNFDGDRHKITGLYINSGEDNEGLFGSVKGAAIQNVDVYGELVAAGQYTGAIVGSASNSRITGCRNYAEITSCNDSTGGVVGGDASGSASVIRNCENHGRITSDGSGCGGIQGYGLEQSIYDCRNFADIHADSMVGGISGRTFGCIENCANYGDVSGTTSCSVGGISGDSGDVACCVNEGDVTGGEKSGTRKCGVGGIMGEVGYGKVRFSYNKGTVHMPAGTNGSCGGIVGIPRIDTYPVDGEYSYYLYYYGNLNAGYIDAEEGRCGAILGEGRISSYSGSFMDGNYYIEDTCDVDNGTYERPTAYSVMVPDVPVMNLDELYDLNTISGQVQNRGAWTIDQDGRIMLSDDEHPSYVKAEVKNDDDRNISLFCNGKYVDPQDEYISDRSELEIRLKSPILFDTLKINNEDLSEEANSEGTYIYNIKNSDLVIEATFTSRNTLKCKEAIEKIGNADSLTSDRRAVVEEAQDAFDDLTWREKKLLSDEEAEHLARASAVMDELAKYDAVLDRTVMPYTGRPRVPQVVVTKKAEDAFEDDRILVRGVDYTVECIDNTDPGDASLVISFWGDHRMSAKIVRHYTVEKARLEDCEVSLSKKEYNYDGREHKPAVTVLSDGEALKEGKDYSVRYEGAKGPGTASVIVIGQGGVTGSAVRSYKIVKKTANTAAVRKGVKFSSGGILYKVTKAAGSTGTVSLYGVAKKKMTRITVPASVKYRGAALRITGIENNTFRKCGKLKNITIKSKNITKVGKYAFKGIHKKAVIKVPKASYKKYLKLFKNKGQKKTVKIRK